MSGWTAWRTVPAAERIEEEQALEHLAEDGFVVTSREVSRDGPWRIEIFGEGERPALHGAWTWEELPEKDWVAENQRSFRPFQVGPFWVHPSHVADGIPAGLLPLRIDAGLAFGTGTHATTRGCLEMLATLDPAETKNTVDVGCGSGILAIAAAKLWQRPVIGGDNDAEAVGVAIENAGTERRCVALPFLHVGRRRSAGTVEARALRPDHREYPRRPSRWHWPTRSHAAVRSGGRVLLSGLLVEQAGLMLSTYERRGFEFERRIDLETGGAWWRTLLLRKS